MRVAASTRCSCSGRASACVRNDIVHRQAGHVRAEQWTGIGFEVAASTRCSSSGRASACVRNDIVHRQAGHVRAEQWTGIGFEVAAGVCRGSAVPIAAPCRKRAMRAWPCSAAGGHCIGLCKVPFYLILSPALVEGSSNLRPTLLQTVSRKRSWTPWSRLTGRAVARVRQPAACQQRLPHAEATRPAQTEAAC